MVTKDSLFRQSRPETKADATTKIAKGIIDAETDAREAKTARLRKSRAERDASEAAQKAQKPAKPRKTPPGKAGARSRTAN